MAKRKRLTPAPAGNPADPLPPADAFPRLRPGLAPPPIAQVAGEASALAALGEISDAFAAARAEGRLLLRLPLSAIDADYLVRDRLGVDAEEMGALIDSLRSHGQRTPVEVVELASGRYGLISGWRRLTALSRLSQEDAGFGTVLAQLRRPDTAGDAYVAMVEENEIRLGLSYYERARIVARAVEQGVFASDKEALQRLFASASRARRSKIGSFLTIYRALDGALAHPIALPERLGLAVSYRLAGDPALATRIEAALQADPLRDAAGELAILSGFAAERETADKAGPIADSVSVPAEKGMSPRRETATNRPPPVPATAGGGHEIRPGVFLSVSEAAGGNALTLSGPGVDPTFRARLEEWLGSGA